MAQRQGAGAQEEAAQPWLHEEPVHARSGLSRQSPDTHIVHSADGTTPRQRRQSGELPREDSLPVIWRSLGDRGRYRRLRAGTQWFGGGFPGGGCGASCLQWPALSGTMGAEAE